MHLTDRRVRGGSTWSHRARSRSRRPFRRLGGCLQRLQALRFPTIPSCGGKGGLGERLSGPKELRRLTAVRALSPPVRCIGGGTGTLGINRHAYRKKLGSVGQIELHRCKVIRSSTMKSACRSSALAAASWSALALCRRKITHTSTSIWAMPMRSSAPIALRYSISIRVWTQMKQIRQIVRTVTWAELKKQQRRFSRSFNGPMRRLRPAAL